MLNLPINEIILEMRKKAFFKNGSLMANCITLYILFSNNLWYEIVLSDGESIMNTCKEPLETEQDLNGQEFQYPIMKFNNLDFRSLGKLSHVFEFFWKGFADESCGFELQFANKKSIYIIEDGENISITTNPTCIKKEWVKKEKHDLNN